MNFTKFLRTLFLKNTSGRRLLYAKLSALFLPNFRGGGVSNKMHHGESDQDFLKWGRDCFWLILL